MIISSTKHIKLDKLARVRNVFPAFNSSFILLTEQHLEETEDIVYRFVHYDHQGTVRMNLVIQADNKIGPTPSTMIDDHTLVYANFQDKKINIVNLIDYSIRTICHQYVCVTLSHASIYYFCQSDLICIIERKIACQSPKSMYEEVRATYYSMKDFSLANQQIHTSFYHRAIFIKANNHSMIIWANIPGWDQYQQFYLFTIPRNKQEQIFCYKKGRISNSNRAFNAWQVQPGIIKLLYGSYAENKLIKYTFSQQSGSLTCQDLPFFVGRYKQMDEQFNLDKFSILSFKDGLTSGIFDHFYLNAKTGDILSVTKEIASNNYCFKTVDYLKDVFVILFHDIAQYTNLTIKTIGIYERKEIHLHFMLHINEDFDDDLLLDAINLLEDK